MTFDIKFLSKDTAGAPLGTAVLMGQITLGGDIENFESVIGFWSPKDYERQWTEGVRRVVRSGKDSCLITSIHDPGLVDVLSWWLLYPEADEVHVQDALCLVRECLPRFSTVDPYRSIPERARATEDGEPVLEWTLPLEEFERFLER